ncbi:aminopeptidase N [Alteromonadaceae bacterium BrNp21-10]|nr:aminopeptidase N [Alteromonadaceae bacterium BrNp21-10]
MSQSLPSVKRLADYQQPDFQLHSVELHFDLQEQATQVVSTMVVEKINSLANHMRLDGTELELLSVCIDGQGIENYLQDDESLTIEVPLQQFTLTITTRIQPHLNSSLEGLYQAQGAYCTQCEAEGFRKITYFLDRPDVLTVYTVTIEADKQQFPYLLSNGNLLDSGETDNGRHWVKWHDPHKKPCYLFALVAGDFDLLEDTFTTASGRQVALQLFVDKGNAHKGHHALASLVKAMAWDEQVYGLEYDLDIYMIVAVDFFNMGAMENKGLNVFNSKYVLADSASATDEDYFNIESVIAHEYFHNWTGNRVTCRDWFQLSLKEGLTVFRDQQFSSDMASAAINRIKNVKVIRSQQFAEDASPMAHPIRPEAVIEMNNFYTVTVYNKGAEVISMLHKLLGVEGYRAGIDLYFTRHDGQAVTCDDFVNAMADANDRDLSLFKRWYSQSGTPIVELTQSFDEVNQQLHLHFSQHTPATADQTEKQPLHIPVDIELLGENGEALTCFEKGASTHVFNLTQACESFVIPLPQAPVAISVLRDFSAPVKLKFDQEDQQLTHIILHASDDFSRWDATQQLLTKYIIDAVKQGRNTLLDEHLHIIEVSFSSLLQSSTIDLALMAEMLVVPDFESLVQLIGNIQVEQLLNIRRGVIKHLATTLESLWLAIYNNNQCDSYHYQQQDVAKRRIKNIALFYLLVANGNHGDLAKLQYHSADNMTDTLGALYACQNNHHSLFDSLMLDFEQRWQHEPLVMDKWFALHAGAEREDILSRLDLLMQHQNFSIKNPNRVRAVVGTFAYYNTQGFHQQDGSGYAWLTTKLQQLDGINSQIAARLVTPLTHFKHFDDQRQDNMKHQLLRLTDTPKISSDLYEKVSKSLS